MYKLEQKFDVLKSILFNPMMFITQISYHHFLTQLNRLLHTNLLHTHLHIPTLTHSLTHSDVLHIHLHTTNHLHKLTFFHTPSILFHTTYELDVAQKHL